METDSTPPTAEDLAICSRMSDVFEYQIVKRSRLTQTEQLLELMDSGVLRKNQNYDLMIKEVENLTAEIEELKAATANDGNPAQNLTKKNNRPDGFTSPTKVAKKQKVLQNYSIGAAAPASTKNKFQLLTENTMMPTTDDTAMSVASPKIPPIHYRFQSNYNLIMQEINRTYPKASSKLSGEFLRILASSTDEHRQITDFLKKKGEQFFALNPVANKPQKIVIKELPISTTSKMN
ncbi:hypothetical protein TNCV_3842591 [Trichonephila clavipes]|nr:hypothetical protein TNCV_3842591 [Trichonephila clavipes]